MSTKRLAARLLGAAACLLVASAAHAQAESELSSSPALRCLTPASDDRVKPVYPPKLYDAKIGASIEAELEFTAPDRRPKVRVEGQPRDEFGDAIEDYAKQLRVPCMTAGGAPVHLRQTFVFTPNDGRKVVWTTPTDTADAGRKELLKCAVKPSADVLSYPREMASLNREGTVLTRVHFFDPKAAPTFEVLYDGGDRSFAAAVPDYIERLRLPCVGSEPVDEDYEFVFRIDGGGSYKRRVLKDLPLQTFLAVVKPIKPGSVYFDTGAMKCPFDVRLSFRQPIESNKIEELEEDVPARHAFLDWLGEREFNLDRKAAGQLYGQSMVVHVPCARLDL